MMHRIASAGDADEAVRSWEVFTAFSEARNAEEEPESVAREKMKRMGVSRGEKCANVRARTALVTCEGGRAVL